MKKIRGRPRKNKTEMGAFANQMRMTRELKETLDMSKHDEESYADEILRIFRERTEMIKDLERKLDECTTQK